MATTTVSDALVFPQSQGTGLSAEEAPNSAAAFMLAFSYLGGEYVDTGYANGMQFTAHDGTNDTVDVSSGACWIVDDNTSSNGQRNASGNPQAQSTTTSGYDTEVVDPAYLVIFPTSVTISLSSSVNNQIWVNITSVSSNNTVEVRSDGGGGTTAEPSDTYIKLGEVNPDNASADTRANDDSAIDTAQLAASAVTPSKVDGSGGTSGQVLTTDGTASGVSWSDEENIVASGTATLSSGVATVSTGVTSTPNYFDIYLDASGNGANTADVKASARAFWDNSVGEYKVEILEDGTSVGNPDIGYNVVQK